jgi:hypothetical protein
MILFADYQRFNKKHPPGVLFFNCLSFRQKNNVCVAPFCAYAHPGYLLGGLIPTRIIQLVAKPSPLPDKV